MKSDARKIQNERNKIGLNLRETRKLFSPLQKSFALTSRESNAPRKHYPTALISLYGFRVRSRLIAKRMHVLCCCPHFPPIVSLYLSRLHNRLRYAIAHLRWHRCHTEDEAYFRFEFLAGIHASAPRPKFIFNNKWN